MSNRRNYNYNTVRNEDSVVKVYSDNNAEVDIEILNNELVSGIVSKNACGGLNIREQPNSDSKILATLKPGASIEICDAKYEEIGLVVTMYNTYLKVKVNVDDKTLIGYCSNCYVDVDK